MTTATKTDAHEAVKAEHAGVIALQSANVEIGAARAAQGRAAQDTRQAAGDIEAAYGAKVRHEPNAAKLLADANKRKDKALAAHEDATKWLEAANHERETAAARLEQIRHTQVLPLVEHAERHQVAPVLAAGRKLAPLLGEYLELWSASQQRFNSLRAATEHYIDEVVDKDRPQRIYRDRPAIQRDAALPPCPIPAAAVHLVASLAPRPAVFQPGYRPAIDDDGVEVIDVDLRTRTE